MAERRSRRLAEVIDSVRWDYDPEAEHFSPLVTTERYFRDFPWEPEDVFASPPAAGSAAVEQEPTASDSSPAG